MNILLKTSVCVVLACRAYGVYEEIRPLEGAGTLATELGCVLSAHDVLKGKDAFANVHSIQDDGICGEESKRSNRDVTKTGPTDLHESSTIKKPASQF